MDSDSVQLKELNITHNSTQISDDSTQDSISTISTSKIVSKLSSLEICWWFEFLGKTRAQVKGADWLLEESEARPTWNPATLQRSKKSLGFSV